MLLSGLEIGWSEMPHYGLPNHGLPALVSIQPPKGLGIFSNIFCPIQGLGNYSVHLVEVDTQGLSLQLSGGNNRLCGAGPSEAGNT